VNLREKSWESVINILEERDLRGRIFWGSSVHIIYLGYIAIFVCSIRKKANCLLKSAHEQIITKGMTINGVLVIV
jgi:hypothetical protein